MLQLLFQQAQHDIEYKASIFWQAFLQHAFPLHENYIVGCEQAPDRQASRARVDIVVLRYDPSHDTLSSMMIIEAKRQGTPQLTQLEAQALGYALAAIDAENLEAIYVMTTWGTTFRLWMVDRNYRELYPLHGNNPSGFREDYIDVDSQESSRELKKAIKFIKGRPPIRHPDVVPSQAWMHPPGTVFGQASLGAFSPHVPLDDDPGTSAEASNTYRLQTPEAGPSRPPQGQHQASHVPDVEMEEEDIAGQSAGASAGGTEGKPWREVRITVVQHSTKKDEWVFKNTRGRTTRTSRIEWVSMPLPDGRLGWTYEADHHRYYTRQNLRNP